MNNSQINESSILIQKKLNYNFDNDNFDLENVEFDLLKCLRTVNCNLNDNSYKEILNIFCYCLSCDPEEKEPICSNCIKCHNNHKISNYFNLIAKCSCGEKNHYVSRNRKDSILYLSKCRFYDWSLLNDKNNCICYFCYLFCNESKEIDINLKQINIQEEDFSKQELNSKSKSINKCTCNNFEHREYKKITKSLSTITFEKIMKLNQILDISNYCINPIQLLNMIFSARDSYNSIFENQYSYFKQISEDLKNEDYFIESSIFSGLKNSLISFDFYLNLPNESLNHLVNFIEELLFTEDFYLNFLLSTINIQNKGLDFWWVLDKLTLIYYKFIFRQKFIRSSSISFYDIFNLNPLLRVNLLNNYIEQCNFENVSIFCSKILNALNNLTQLETFNSKYIISILENLIDIFHDLSSINLLLYDHKIKFGIIIEEIIYILTNKLEKDNEHIDKLLLIIKKILEIFTYFIVYDNDLISINILKMEIEKSSSIIEFLNINNNKNFDFDFKEIQFFHSSYSENELMKIIYKNNINIMSYLNSHQIKIVNNSMIYYDCFYISSILNSFLFNSNEFYLNSLRLIISIENISTLLYVSDFNILYDLFEKDNKDNQIINNINIAKIKIKKINDISNTINDYYYDYYTNKNNFNELEIKLNIIMNDIFDIFDIDKVFIPSFKNISIKDFLSILEKKTSENINQDENYFNIINSEYLKDNFKYYFLIYEFVNFSNLKDSQNILNKSFIISNILKFLKIKSEYINIKEKSKSTSNNITFDFENKILKFLLFYTYKNINSCLLLIQSEILFYIGKSKDEEFIYFFEYLLDNLIKNKIKISNSFCIFNHFKIISNNISFKYAIQLIMKIHLLEVYEEEKKIYQTYDSLKEIFLINSRLEDNIGGYLFSNLINSDLNFEYILFLKMLNKILIIGKNQIIEEEKLFLNNLLTIEEIYEILFKYDISINLRLEVLNFLKLLYIDILIEKSRMNEYQKIISYKYPLVHKNELIGKKFMIEIISLGNSFDNFDLIFKIIKNELIYIQNKNVKEIFENIPLFEIIFLSLYIFVKKFLNIMFKFDGYTILNLYEITLIFLELKINIISYKTDNKKIYEQNQILKKNNNHSENKDINIKTQNINHKFGKLKKAARKIKYINNIFNVRELKFNKENYSLYNQYKSILQIFFNINDLERTQQDIYLMKKKNFEVFNVKLISTILENHLNSIMFENLNEDLLFKKFDKKIKIYNNFEDIIEKNDIFDLKSFKDFSNLKSYKIFSDYIQNIFFYKCVNLIIIYENLKCKIGESQYFKNLAEKNIIFSSSYRQLLIKNKFFKLNNSNFIHLKNETLWHLFKILQNDTKNIQYDIEKLYDRNTLSIYIMNLINIFTINILSLIFSSYNPTVILNNENYFMSINIIKILKYLCEEHNIYFQTIFFDLINKINFSSQKINKFNKFLLKKNISSKMLPSQRSLNFTKSQNEIEIHNIKLITDKKIIQIEEFDFNNFENIKLFDFFMDILTKIIIISNWDDMENTKLKDHNERLNNYYFYDIFFALIELIIEIIQGTTLNNLSSILDEGENENNKDYLSSFSYFLIISKSILFSNHISDMIFRIKIDIFNLIMAFLEEKSTPDKLIFLIILNIPSINVAENLLFSMKILLQKLISDFKDYKFLNQIDENLFDINARDFCLSIFLENKIETYNEFEYCKKLFIFIKYISDELGGSEALSIFSIFEKYQEKDIIQLYNNIMINKFNHNKSLHDDYEINSFSKYNYELYFIISFFDKITKTVFVSRNNITDNRVIFIINPKSYYISDETKVEFLENVNRSKRYTKIISILENIENFCEEGEYNYLNTKTNKILKYLNKINYMEAQFFSFIINFIINIILVIDTVNYVIKEIDCTIESNYNYCKQITNLKTNENEILFKSLQSKSIIIYLTYIMIFFNTGIIIIWLFKRYPLYIKQIGKKYFMKMKNISISQLKLYLKTFFFYKFYEIFPFIWHIFFSIIALINKNNFWVFSLELLIVYNLSTTLKTIILSIRVRCGLLISILIFIFIFCIFFTYFCFYNLKKNIVFKLSNLIEDQCSSIINCLLAVMNYGIRTDGGIWEHMVFYDYNLNPKMYFLRHIYDNLFFIVILLILLALFFAIIIDSFAQLREHLFLLEEDKKNICFICGINRNKFENGGNFEYHKKKVHNIWNYVYYIISLKYVDLQEANSINSYVIECINNKSISWFPFEGEESYH